MLLLPFGQINGPIHPTRPDCRLVTISKCNFRIWITNTVPGRNMSELHQDFIVPDNYKLHPCEDSPRCIDVAVTIESIICITPTWDSSTSTLCLNAPQRWTELLPSFAGISTKNRMFISLNLREGGNLKEKSGPRALGRKCCSKRRTCLKWNSGTSDITRKGL
jgi:hypothetical protein